MSTKRIEENMSSYDPLDGKSRSPRESLPLDTLSISDTAIHRGITLPASSALPSSPRQQSHFPSHYRDQDVPNISAVPREGSSSDIEPSSSLPSSRILTPSASLPTFPPLATATTPAASFWGSIVNPLKRLWEVPTVHLSTYYGLPNQPGRPGPVLAVFVERSVTRARSKVKRQPHQKQSSATPASASSASSSYKSGLDLRTSFAGLGRSSASNASPPTHYEEVVPEIEGVLMVTPRAIERYQLNGTIVKRAALPEAITAFHGTKIAGVGRVFLCGTQAGRVHVLKTDLLDSMLVFDTGCLKGTFLNALKRAQESELLPPHPTLSPSTGRDVSTASGRPSQFSYAQQNVESLPSVFANPPRLLAEALLAVRSTPAPLEHAFSWQPVKTSTSPPESPLVRSAGIPTIVPHRSLQPSPRGRKSVSAIDSPRTSIIQSGVGFPPIMELKSDQFEALNRLGSINGDGMTPALIEGRTKELKEDLGTEMLTEILSRLATTRKGQLLIQGSRIGGEFDQKSEKKRASMLQSSRRRSSPIRLSQFNIQEVQLLKELGEHLRSESSGVCSLAVKCSFGSFTEAVLAGTEDGEVFVWEVPSGRLLQVLEYPGMPGINFDDDSMESTARSRKKPSVCKSEEDAISLHTLAHESTCSTGLKEGRDVGVDRPDEDAEGNSRREVEGIEIEDGSDTREVSKSGEQYRGDEGQSTDRMSSVSLSSSHEGEYDSHSCQQNPYIGAIQVLHVSGHLHHVYVGYGNGCIAVFDLKSAECLKCWCVPGNDPIVSIDIASSIGAVLILSGNNKLSIWNCKNFELIKSFCTEELTSGTPLSCLKVVDPEKRSPAGPAATLFFGCVDGSIYVHRLFWDAPWLKLSETSSTSGILNHKQSYGTLIPSSITATQSTLRSWSGIEVGASVHSIEGLQSRLPSEQQSSSSSNLQCVLIRAFRRETEPLCPVTSLWIDSSLDTAFIGDASGVVATLLPIRYLLESTPTSTTPPTVTSPPRQSKDSAEVRVPPLSARQSPSSHQLPQSRLESFEFKPTSPKLKPSIPKPRSNQPVVPTTTSSTSVAPPIITSGSFDDATPEPRR